MNTFTVNSEKGEASGRNSVLLATAMLACITTGWCLGSITTQAFSRSENNNNIILHSVPMKGESLPTILLSEFSVIAEQTTK